MSRRHQQRPEPQRELVLFTPWGTELRRVAVPHNAAIDFNRVLQATENDGAVDGMSIACLSDGAEVNRFTRRQGRWS